MEFHDIPRATAKAKARSTMTKPTRPYACNLAEAQSHRSLSRIQSPSRPAPTSSVESNFLMTFVLVVPAIFLQGVGDTRSCVSYRLVMKVMKVRKTCSPEPESTCSSGLL